MSRTILALLLFILFGVGATLFFEQDNGYVLLRYGDLVVETSIVFFAVALVVFLSALLLAWRALRISLGLPQWLPAIYQRYQSRNARRSLLRGLLLSLEGRWPAAEKELARRTGREDARLVNFLHAAIAAQKQGATERRDYYLQQAAEVENAENELAILLTQAQLQLEAGQHTQAIASLELIRQKHPDHAAALATLLLVSSEQRDWVRVRELWAEARQQKVLAPDELLKLGRQAYSNELENAAGQGLEALDNSWRALPRSLRQDDELLLLYTRLLAHEPAGHAEALRLISVTLKQRWEPEMALLYAELETDEGTSQLAAVEGWIKQHGEQPELQLLAGQLCLRNKLWGRARSYLDAVINRNPDARAWLALGELNEQTEDATAAAKAYAEGLKLAIQQNHKPS